MVLFEDDSSPTTISIELKEDSKGGLTLFGHDVGDAPRRTFGHEDYEYSVTVPADGIRALAFQLLAEEFKGDPSAVSRLRELCNRRQIPCSFWSWP